LLSKCNLYRYVGVDYNERTGECAFLILDPHYTVRTGEFPLVGWNFSNFTAHVRVSDWLHGHTADIVCVFAPV
jgi:hypothetical protein